MTFAGFSWERLPLVNRLRLTTKESLVREIRSLRHTSWECKYHIVFIPKYRKKVIYKGLRRHLGEVFRELVSGLEATSCRR